MGHQVILAPSARVDLREIVRYIALNNPVRAKAFGQFLLTSTRRLTEYREMGRKVPEFRERSLREIVVRIYRAIYRLGRRGREVELLRFWHGARGVPDLR